VIQDLLTVARKEWLEFLQPEPTRGLRPVRGLLLIIGGGLFMGWQMDPDFGRSWLTVFLVGFLAVMFVTGVIPDSIAGERERHTLETLLATRLPDHAVLLGKVLAAVSYGCAMGFAVLPAGIVAANLIHGSGGLPWVRVEVIATAVSVAVLGGLLVAALGVLLSLYAPTARQANQRLGFSIMAIFFLPAVIIPVLPTTIRQWALERLETVGLAVVLGISLGVLGLTGVGLLLVALHRFRRSQLIV
jgi:ABC-2 type transport system permease protein